MYIHTCVYIYIYMYVCMYTHTYICICIYIYKYIHIGREREREREIWHYLSAATCLMRPRFCLCVFRCVKGHHNLSHYSPLCLRKPALDT